MTLVDDAKPTNFKKLSKTKCPLCDRDATVHPVHHSGAYRRFQCKKCKIFATHEHDIERIASLPKSKKEKIIKASIACPIDSVLVIRFDDNTKEPVPIYEPEHNWS